MDPDGISLGRLVLPKHIADAVLFYCSAGARMVTGTSLDVDGGISLGTQGMDAYFAARRGAEGGSSSPFFLRAWRSWVRRVNLVDWPCVHDQGQGRLERAHAGDAGGHDVHIYDFKVILEPDETGGYVVSCPSIPGCYSQGETIDEALANIKEAIELCLEVMQEGGEDIPDPSRVLVGSVIVTR